MAKKILVPVFPSEWFYDAVVRAGELVARDGGLVTFAFTAVRPSPDAYNAVGDGRPTELEVAPDAGDYDARDLENWRAEQISGLEEARALLYERGVGDEQIDYIFADEADAEGAAQAIADEAAAGAYDVVLLARGYFDDEVEEEESTPQEIAQAVRELDGVQLMIS
jgi:hypothetical protein